MHKGEYRLGKYKIIEYGERLITWETHAALGEQVSGKCVQLGDVLVIGHADHHETGYLIGEFLDLLDSLPAWKKTRYYCFAPELLDVVTGQEQTDESLERRSSRADAQSSQDMSPGKFRLGHYLISVAAEGAVSWKSAAGNGRIVSGRCEVLGPGILFIGPQESEEAGKAKEDFLAELNRSPQWDRTAIWSRQAVLRLCRPEQAEEDRHRHQTERPRPPAPPREKRQRPDPDRSTTAAGTPYREVVISFFGRAAQRMKIFRLGLGEWKNWWKYLAAAVLAAFLIGLVAAVTLVKKHESHKSGKHHERHDDHRE